MRVSEVHIEGERAGRFALVRRFRGGHHLHIELLLGPQDSDEFDAKADDRAEIWSAAVRIQARLDGRTGTNGDVASYYGLLEQLSDL